MIHRRADKILDVLARASVGDLQARIDTDPDNLEDDYELIANAINLLLDDLVYRQRERERALEEAAEARAKEEFLAHLSHDMQTPLAVLLGYVDVLDPDLLDDQGLEDITTPMRHAARTLERYARRFLDYARLEAEQPLIVRREAVDVAAVISEVMAMFARDRTVSVDIAVESPIALADEERVERIIANLVSNAISHAGPDAKLAIEVSGDETTLEVAVVDDGIGMTAGQLADAFRKFERGSGATSTAGAGLGLYMSRALAEAQSGRLLATSAPGEGSRFTLVLPRR